MNSGSQSSYNALQTSVGQSYSSYGLSFQASYTYSKSIDDASALLGGVSTNAGVILQTLPQNPLDTRAEKAASVFDVTQVFSLSLIEDLPLGKVGFLQPLGKYVTDGWQFLNITTLASGRRSRYILAFSRRGWGRGERTGRISSRCRIFRRAGRFARIISGGARTTRRSSRFPLGCRAGRGRTRGGSGRSGETRFAGLDSISSTSR